MTYGPRFLGGPAPFTPTSSPYGVTILGEQGNFLNTYRVADMQNMGIWWLRFFITWKYIEATQTCPNPTYDWTEFDAAVSLCNEAGINFVYTTTLPPAWHCYGYAFNPTYPCYPATPPNPCDPSKTDWAVPADAAVFAAAVAHRYTVGDPANATDQNPGPNFGKGLHIEAIEVANEGYDDGHLSCQDGSWAVPVSKAIYQAVKAVNPNILVLSPAQLHIEKVHMQQWITNFYAAGGGPYCDVHQIHTYFGERGPFTDDGIHFTMQGAAKCVHDVAAQYGHPNRPVWFTEAGYAQNNLPGSMPPCNVDGNGNPISGYDQQSCLLQQNLDAGRLSNGLIDKIFLYTLAGSDGFSPVSGQSNEVFHPGYYMYQAYTAQYPVWKGGTSPPVLSVDKASLSFSGIAGGAPVPPQTVTLSDTSVTGTDWTSSIAYVDLPAFVPRALSGTIPEPKRGANWLTLVPSSGTLAGNANVPVAFTSNAGVLAAGTYTATVTFTAVTGGATAQVTVTFIVSPASASLLSLYGTNVASSLLTTAGTFALVLGGTETTVGTLIGASLGFGELTALGTGAPWPALPGPIGSIAPTGKGWLLPVGLLDNQTMDAGTWTANITVRFGGANGQAVTSDFYVRVFLYDSNFATFTQLGQFLLLAQHLNSNTRVVLSLPDLPNKAAQAFQPGQTLYVDLMPNVTASTLGAGANAFVYESSNGGAGLSADLAIGFPGYSPSNPTLPQNNTYSVLISDQLVNVVATSLSVKSTIGRRGEADMTVFDPTGNTHLQQWQRLSVYDKLQNLVFSGYVTSPQETKTGFQPMLETRLTATDQHYLADKRVVATYYLNKNVGAIVKDLVNTILSQEGVTIGKIVNAGSAIPQVTFSYCTVADALDAMVTEASSGGTPYYWMIDQFKALFFVPYTANVGPAVDGTTVDDGHLSGMAPTVTRANPAYRNTQYVTGGNAATSTVTETRLGDGHTRSWTMGYPIASAPDITVDGTAQQVGIKGTSGFDFYWAAGDPTLTQDKGNPVLTSSNTLSVTYVGQYPSVFTGKNTAQIAEQAALDGTSGIVENTLDDNTIASVQDGLARVGQQLSVYGTRGLLFTFNTLTPGYQASQLCPVNYPPLGLNNLQMLIEEVDASDQQDGYNLWYTVKAIVGPYDNNWQAYFGKLQSQGQPNSINVGQSGGGQVPTPNFTEALSVAMTFNATIGACWYPSSTSYPSSTLYPPVCP